jgi:Uma2 family endonuclease
MVEHAVTEPEVEASGFTVEQWLEFDGAGDLRVELIDGALVVTPAPAGRHQMVANRLVILLAEALGASDPTVEATGMGVVSPDMRPEQGLIPDVLVARSTESMAEEMILAAADVVLAVEVLSPPSRARDRVDKLRIFAGMGIPHYWIVDPRAPVTITTLVLDGGSYQQRDSASGDEALSVTDPFQVTLTPSALASKRATRSGS